MSSYFLGDPPPDPRFLASLGTLQIGNLQLHHCKDLDVQPDPALTEHPEHPGPCSDGAVSYRFEACRAKRENGGLGEDPPGSTMTY
jgi:hypothetical protein